MSWISFKVLRIYILYQFVISVSFALVSVSHVGDFMEFHVTLHAACSNITDGETMMELITSGFAACTNKINKDEPKDLYGTITAICKNRDKYFQCWDKMKEVTLENCGRDKEKMLPVLYRNTVFSFCGRDYGALKLEDMRKAFRKIAVTNFENCPETGGTDWLENCKDSMSSFIVSDLCKRHEAINNCVWKVTCGNFRGAGLIRRMYSDGRALLQCKE